MIGKELGRYLIVEALGEGGMAAVYKGYDRRLNRDVAIKVILRGYQQSDVFSKRFEREAKAVAQLTHPNIVSVIDYGSHEGVPYLVMEYIPGGTLKEMMGKPFSWMKAAKLLVPIARALDHAHHENIIHRDIKPANILVTKSGDMMLSDFGIAKSLAAEGQTKLTGTGMGIGTPSYMAPEQGMGKTVDQRADIYSLGVVFYEMVTGRPPYEADTPMAVMLKHMMDPLPRPRLFVPDLPEKVEQVIFRALAKEPDERFQSMEAFANALDELARGDEPRMSWYEAPKDMPVIETTYKVSPPASLGQSQIPAKPITREQSFSKRVLRYIWIPLVLGGLCAVAATIFAVPRLLKAFLPEVKATPTEEVVAIQATDESRDIISTETATLEPSSEATEIIFQTEIPFETVAPEQETDVTMISPMDEAVLVFVPGGEFSMGASSLDSRAETDEQPQHNVYLDDYWIDQTEVTNQSFAKFVDSTGYVTEAEQDGWSWDYDGSWIKTKGADWRHPLDANSSLQGRENYPVVRISWNDAAAYCRWAERRLPTEAEWEKAARGTDGRIYPWGNDSPNPDLLNFDRNIQDSVQVGSYSTGVSPYGVFDMAGNVWEWVSDWYTVDYYKSSPNSNPQGPGGGDGRAMRGGSWFLGGDAARASNREWGYQDASLWSTGFRCAMDAVEQATRPTETQIPPTETPLPTIASSPVTGMIAFQSNRSGNNDIYVMLPDGSQVRRLTFSSYDDRAPSWSPSGKEIAYQSNSDGDYEIYIVEVDSGNIRQVTNNDCDDYSPVWSPDGKQFVFYSDCDGNREIYKIDANGSNRKQLTSTSGYYNWFPSWSPDGSKIVYSSNRSGKYQVYVMSSNGDNPRALAYGCVPFYSPDGAKILFNQYCTDSGNIWVMDADGSNAHALTEAPYDNCKNPSWSPDGTRIVFQSEQSGNFEIWMMDVDGTNWIQLTDDPSLDAVPVWHARVP